MPEMTRSELGELAILAVVQLSLGVPGNDLRRIRFPNQLANWTEGTELAKQVFDEATKQAVQQATSDGNAPDDNNENLEVKSALEDLDSILEMCEEMPERGEDFAESVREQAEDMRGQIERSEHVTPRQLRAIENWTDALGKWLHRD